MANAERMVPEKVSRMAMSPGISKFALRMSGLKSITGCASIAASRLLASIRLMLFDSTTPFAAFSAAVATVESDPSISTSTFAGRLSARLRA